ncbi:MAG: translation initiation factor IF-6 [Theionarchaea archaeon]|nr:translation initiation factor IF-6 [Theionarchaea archaeon]MBU7000755.1 translation initiation factor IF-6 [Theionarchaea archaeon]MBU7021462.1 translation initiation factor IF-6 [Theionarchaea archaeon]MBU7033597.1 translation initiation factor IF-6 [Theionarchaea archaeon]MBU7040718.1 translation initiation factor IF-6 [Theionarchaea archaeon]
MISKLDFEGISFIGVYGLCTDTITLIRPDLGKKLATVEQVLNTPVLETTIGKSYLIGVFAAGNSTCVVVPYFAEDAETESLREHVTCAVYPEKYTALGNLMLANDKACIVSPVLDPKFFQDALGTEVVRAQLGEFLTVGSVGVVTNRAGILHPQLSDEDIEFVEDVLQISCERATANRGVGYLKLCLLANSHGILAGRETTGPELVRIEDILEG